jgi:hypothetical protein
MERARRLAAQAWGARRTWFLVNGGSQGNHAACLALAQLGRRVIVQRNVHSSTIDGIILAGLEPTFVSPDTDPERGIIYCLEPEALDRALIAARAFEPSSISRRRLPAVVTTRIERSYPEMRYPGVEHSVLAAFRIWTTILHFYPYRDLLDHDWELVLGEHLPSFIGARSAEEYARAVAGMVERVQDSHAYLAGALVTEELVPTGFPPIRVRMIEDTPVVTRVDARAPEGISVGDVVVAVDGDGHTLVLGVHAANEFGEVRLHFRERQDRHSG